MISNLKKSRIKQLPKVTKAWFNELDESRVPEKISFAFLDGDYYYSILDPLKLIWPKLERGAIIVVDDYGNHSLPGASKAVDEWCDRYNILKKVESSLAILCKS